jgi:lantibiotic modifying enzyme
LYSGWTGIAYTAVRAGVLLQDGQLVREGLALMARSGAASGDTDEFDIISGRAGAVLACLAAHSLLGDPMPLGIATSIGESLIERIQVAGAGSAWSGPGRGRRLPLTGFAHGTAGAATALIELYGMTGDARYRRVAESAFDYERASFDPVAGNWPDFRWGAGRREHQTFATSWCHGAPGIALSRARAWTVSNDPARWEEADAGLATTRTAIAGMLEHPMPDWSLCHGLTGNIEIVQQAAELLGTNAASHRAAALAAAAEVCKRRPREWRTSGTTEPAAPDPTLMLGLAGIGMFFLRLSGAHPASVLLLPNEPPMR